MTISGVVGGDWVALGSIGSTTAETTTVRSAGLLATRLSIALLAVASLSIGLGLFLLLGSSLQYHASQSTAFARFRSALAAGTAPIGPTQGGRPLPLGTPIGLLEIPALHLRVVVAEGTTGAVLAGGPGHEVSTVFPGGTGTSVVMGRAASFGGPFARLAQLRRGAPIVVRTGAGTETFVVVDRRTAGQPIPPLPAGAARLTLVTATGSPFFPNGAIWIDADAVGSALPAAPPLTTRVPEDQRPMAGDPAALALLAGWALALIVVLVAATWAWRRHGQARTWIVFSGPLVVIGFSMANEIARWLPNLT